MQKITPFLWFDNQAEEAMKFYTSIFKNSKIVNVSRYGEGGPGQAGTVMSGTFELEGQQFMALNGGPMFKFTEAVSFFVSCKDQKEVDYYWNKLLKGGEASQCGWLKDKYGVSWQVTPKALQQMLSSGTAKQITHVTQAFLKMKKFDIAELERAYQD